MLAGVVGLLIGLGAAFLIDYLDDKIRSEDDLELLADRPVLAVVPVDPPPDNRPIAISRPADEAVEAYRGLRTNVQFLGLDQPISVVQLTSSMAGEGKTTTSANLAVVLAQAGHRVALVDADLRRPRIHEVFGIAQAPGFTDLLLGAEPETSSATSTSTAAIASACTRPAPCRRTPANCSAGVAPSSCSTRWASTTTS